MVDLRSIARRAALTVPQVRRLQDWARRAEAERILALAARAEAEAARDRALAEHAVLEKRLAELEEDLRSGRVRQEQECEALGLLLGAAERERDLLEERLKGEATARSQLQGAQAVLAEQLAELRSEAQRLPARIEERLRLLGQQVLARFGEMELRLRGTAGIATAASLPGAGGGTAAELYLDLIERALTGVLYEDGAISPSSAGGYDPDVRALGRDWPARAETMIGTARMRNLRLLCERALAEEIPGDFIETGVWRGGACIYMRAILAAHGDPGRRVFVADSFRGLPPPDPAAFPADEGDQHHTFAELAVPRAEVEANFRRYGLLDERVVFLEGWFRDTLPAAPIERLALLRLDGDMYESTMEALEALYHKVSPGGFVIVDDYILKPCAQAVDEFRARHGIAAPLQQVDGAAVWWRVGG